jgi:hypothetical protein
MVLYPAESVNRISTLREPLLLFLVGACLSISQFVMIRDFVTILYGEEVVIILVTAAFFLGLSIGYFLSFEAIFTIKGQKIATISGENFVKGDFAFGKRVTQIFKNRVVLDAGGKEESLILEDTTFTIRKHMQN